MDDTKQISPKEDHMVKSAINKASKQEVTNMFQKNFHYLKQSINLKRKKREHRKNKLSEAVEYSEKYSSKRLIEDRRKRNFEDVNHSELGAQRVNLSTLSSKMGSKAAKKLARKYLYSGNTSEYGGIGSIKTNYSELGSKFNYKRSPREIFKEVSAQEQKKKGVFTKSHNKKSTLSRKMDVRKFKMSNPTGDNLGKISKNISGNRTNNGSVRGKNSSFKSETGEFGSISRKFEYQTSVTNTLKSKKSGKSAFGKRVEKSGQLDSVIPDTISIYKKLHVDGLGKKIDKKMKILRKDKVKSREIAIGRDKKELRGYSKVSKKRGKKTTLDKERTQESMKTTPEKKKFGKYRQASKKIKSKKSQKSQKSQKKSFDEELSHRSNVKHKSKSKKKKKKKSYDTKKFSRKNTFGDKKTMRTGLSKQKRRLNRNKKNQFKDLNPKITQTMSKAERNTSEMNSFHKKSLQTSRNLHNSSNKRLREKSQKFLNHNFKNRLKGKEFLQTSKAKTNHSVQKSIRKDVSIDHSRNKKLRKGPKKKNSMVLKNFNDLSLKLKGDVRVIYKGEKGKRKLTQGLYTKNKYVFTDIKKGVDRDSLIGQKMEMIYNQERGSRKKEDEHDHKGFREIPHVEVNKQNEDAPNIYNQQGIKNKEKSQNPKKREDSGYINLNEKKIRVSGFRKDTSSNRKRKLTSNRKLSSLSKIVRKKRSKEKSFRSYKSNLKNKLGDNKEKRMYRESIKKRSDSKRNSRSRLYTPVSQVSKTNIYKKSGPEINCPKSEIEFEGGNIKNSIYLKSEEIKPEEGTTISEKTENSLACQENISKRLQISQSPEHNLSDRRGRQSTKNGEPENVYFETEKGDLEYAKSEDLGKEGRINGIVGEDLGKARRLADVTSLEEKEDGKKVKKMKLSQSDAGNWKKMVKFTGARSGDFDIKK